MSNLAHAQRLRLLWGVAATMLASLGAALIRGGDAVSGAIVFGLVATGLHLVAARAMRRTGQPASPDHWQVYAMGQLLRLIGVVALGAAIALDRRTFDPWASSIGYLGTVLPLLYLETRLGA